MQRRVGEEGTIVVSVVQNSVADVSGLVSMALPPFPLKNPGMDPCTPPLHPLTATTTSGRAFSYSFARDEVCA